MVGNLMDTALKYYFIEFCELADKILHIMAFVHHVGFFLIIKINYWTQVKKRIC